MKLHTDLSLAAGFEIRQMQEAEFSETKEVCVKAPPFQ